ncbi:PQQ-dependent sugar dehydrogenase [Hymenobacter sp. BT683]|uniref:PQQ-dependent sugar dehydrogenase n=1 Tax=Hymenobacter jeongseonensis TaxID=2791027 RepID=A0ABS0IJS8_9BACT|nr:PQQ-dependent sugar dehydrogenase [Hymenobacter jeongseonensis]MBF9238629.1 PQQ-dependent sugar dehydrogenase [Hymenobacter jeongseonensis]
MKQPLICLLAGSLAFGACSRNGDTAAVSTTPAPSGSPVETNAPNATYRPAFTGQTRVPSVTTAASSYRATVLTSSLTNPWGITPLPDGRLLITEKAGRMRLVTATGTVSEPITGLPPVNSSGQGGLLGLCIDPDFATNRMVYWSFSEVRPGGNLTAIAKGRLATDERTIEGAAVIYRAEPAYAGANHYGGRVVFDRTGHLVVSTGERSDLATRPQAQSVTSALGKLIRITKDGQPAPGNPVFAQAGARPELYSIGHRNPQGLAVHPVTGDIWQSEHGPRGGDELNRPQAGANYGWPIITYGLEYSGQPVGGAIQQGTGLEQPVYYWDPVVSPSGMTFYAGNRIAEWQNNLFIGALSGMHIVRLVIENNRVVGEERLLASEGQRFRDITQGTDGALYAVTDQGRLYRIARP